jgi:cytochrome c553
LSVNGRLSRRAALPLRRVIVAIALISAGLMAAAVLPASAQSVEERLPVCLACHGEKGQSETPEVPSLGGMPEFFLTIQLYMFREKLRAVEIMNEVTKGLSDDDLRKMAGAIAKLPPPKPSGDPPDPARVQKALALIPQNRCNSCHGANLAGDQNVPRLAGQREDYLMKTLREYKNNTRRGYDASMADVMYPITDDDIGVLAHYLSRLP